MKKSTTLLFLKILRLIIIAAIGLLSAGGGFAGQSGRAANTQSVLTVVAYVLFAAVLLALALVCAAVWYYSLDFNKREIKIKIKEGDMIVCLYHFSLFILFLSLRASLSLSSSLPHLPLPDPDL